MKKQKVDKGYKVSQVAIASLGFAACVIFWQIYNTYVPLILDAKLRDLGDVVLSATTISTLTGLIMTIDNLFGLVFQPIFGRLSDRTRSRFGKRMPFLIVGVPVCAILFALVPYAAEIAGVAGIFLMMAIIIVFNFVMSAWRAPCVAIMPDFVPTKYQSEGNSIVNLVSTGATIIGMASAGILGAMGFADAINNGEYHSLFIFASGFALLFLVIILFFVKWKDNRNEVFEEVKTVEGKKENLININLPKDVKRSMYIMMIALFFISGASDGGNTYNSLFATKTLNMEVTNLMMLSAAGAMVAAFFAIPAGKLGTKIGRRKTICIGLTINILHRLMYAILPMFLGHAFVWPLFFLFGTLGGIGGIMITINTLPIMLSIGGEKNFGAFTGYYYLATYTAAVVCPTLIGFLVGITNSYITVQVFCMIVSIIAFICILSVKHGDSIDEKVLAKAVEEAERD